MKKYKIIAIDEVGNEVGLEPYVEDEKAPEILFDSKAQACAFYDVVKMDLSPHSVKMLTVKEA